MSEEQNKSSTEATQIKGSTPVEIPNEDQQQTGRNDQATTSTLADMFLKRYMRFDPISIAFTVLILIGGLVGFILKGSTISLVSGTIFAILLGFTTYIEGVKRISWPIMLVLLALGSMMFYRYSVAESFMPSGLVAVLTLIMFLRHACIWYLRNEEL